jgi:hypothetical protein
VVPLVADLTGDPAGRGSPDEAARAAENALRDRLESLLRSGLRTRWLERADSSELVNRIVAELQALRPDAYVDRLRAAGFSLQAYAAEDIAQSCATCMYYETHRQFCALPELMLPVRGNWSCSLWRI